MCPYAPPGTSTKGQTLLSTQGAGDLRGVTGRRRRARRTPARARAAPRRATPRPRRAPRRSLRLVEGRQGRRQRLGHPVADGRQSDQNGRDHLVAAGAERLGVPHVEGHAAREPRRRKDGQVGQRLRLLGRGRWRRPAAAPPPSRRRREPAPRGERPERRCSRRADRRSSVPLLWSLPLTLSSPHPTGQLGERDGG